MFAFALLAAVVAAAPPSTGPCAVAGKSPCVIELHGPHAPSWSANCLEEPWSRYVRPVLPERLVDSNKDGWWETVVEIALDPARECGCATMRIDFEDPIDSWSVNIGDSPTNNGLGGDEGTTLYAAELNVLRDHLSVFTVASPNLAALRFDRILDIGLPPMGGRRADFEVCDEALTVDIPDVLAGHRPLHWKLQTPLYGLLYSFAPRPGSSGSEGASKKDKGLYAGFNRVIFEADKPTSTRKERVGTGARRVEITLSP